MLRVDMQDSADALIVRLEGRFTGDGAEHARMLMTRCDSEKGLVVDLTEVTFVDSIGEAALSFFGRLGAKFVAEDAYTLDVLRAASSACSSKWQLPGGCTAADGLPSCSPGLIALGVSAHRPAR